MRECTSRDTDAILQLDAQWEQENIAHDFLPISREAVGTQRRSRQLC
jgi:hypothetical protein